MKTLYVNFDEIRADGTWVATVPDDVEELYEGETVVAYDENADTDVIVTVEWVDNQLGLALVLPSEE
jgi:hypothetical protein